MSHFEARAGVFEVSQYGEVIEYYAQKVSNAAVFKLRLYNAVLIREHKIARIGPSDYFFDAKKFVVAPRL